MTRRRLTIEEIAVGSSSGDEAQEVRGDPDAAGSSEEATPEREAPATVTRGREDEATASGSAEDEADKEEAEDEDEEAAGTEGTPGRGPRKSRVSLQTLNFVKNSIFLKFFSLKDQIEPNRVRSD